MECWLHRRIVGREQEKEARDSEEGRFGKRLERMRSIKICLMSVCLLTSGLHIWLDCRLDSTVRDQSQTRDASWTHDVDDVVLSRSKFLNSRIFLTNPPSYSIHLVRSLTRSVKKESSLLCLSLLLNSWKCQGWSNHHRFTNQIRTAKREISCKELTLNSHRSPKKDAKRHVFQFLLERLFDTVYPANSWPDLSDPQNDFSATRHPCW